MADWNAESTPRNRQVVGDYTYLRYYDDKFVTFTKYADGVDNLPITTLKVGDAKPCANPLDQPNSKIIAYPTEIM